MLHIVCLVKFVPDLNDFKYDYERNVLVRENVSLELNPDDAHALALALKWKKQWTNTHVRVVSMGPSGVLEQLRDLLRRGVDEATLLSDSVFAGSDSYVTSKILSAYLTTITADLVLTGTRALDGDTSHVPSQVAECLCLPQMMGVLDMDWPECTKEQVIFHTQHDDETLCKYRVQLPALLGISFESKAKLPFVKFRDLEKEVDDRIIQVSNKELKMPREQLGLMGSPTRVVRSQARIFEKKEQIVVKVDPEGIDYVYQFLKAKEWL